MKVAGIEILQPWEIQQRYPDLPLTNQEIGMLLRITKNFPNGMTGDKVNYSCFIEVASFESLIEFLGYDLSKKVDAPAQQYFKQEDEELRKKKEDKDQTKLEL